jgi:hypothetical protein
MPRIAEFDRQALTALVRRQHGVVGRAQALECGMTGRVVAYRSRVAGPWQMILPGVYLTHTGSPADEERELAALIYAGPQSVLTGRAALRRHGLPGHQRSHEMAGPRRDAVDVLVPVASQRADAEFARLHRTARLPELINVAGEARFVFPARAVADTVRGMADLSDVRAVVAESVQRGRCSVAQLAEELARGPVRGSALLRQALAEVADGIRSTAEADLRDLIVWARLPMPMFNPRLMVGQEFLAQPDCWWPEAGVAAEADSRAWHIAPDDWENTMARHARMSAQGIIVLHFAPKRIRGRRNDVADIIRKALAAGAGRSLPQIRALPA